MWGRREVRWEQLCVIGLTVVPVVSQIAGAQVVFTEVGEQRGIRPYVMAVGPIGAIAASDYDNDGFVDVFVPNAEGVPDQLYHNLGDGVFEEVAADVGLASLENNRGPCGSIMTATIGSIWSSAPTATPTLGFPIPAPTR